MIKRQYTQRGSSLFEVLVAIVLTCSIVLGLIKLQSILSTNLEQAKKRLQAERIAFQLLDVYPHSIALDLPNHWQYQIIDEQYNDRCNIVKVTIQPLYGNDIHQERWFCRVYQ